MNRIPKPKLIEEHKFPVESSISYGVEEGFHELHWHDETEICYIKKGTGKYLINGTDYNFTAGDIFIINNDDIHLCHDDNNLVMQVVMFDFFFIGSGSANPLDFEYLRFFTDSLYSGYKKIDHSCVYAPVLADILTEIQAEYENTEKGYEMMIKSLLLKFFTILFRNIPENPVNTRIISRNAFDKIRSIILYIDMNYQKSIDLKFLEDKFEISRPYLCNTFKSLTGISPVNYIIRKRITEAKHLLINTDKSILTISEECGFRSLSNFNSLFRKFTGTTPRSYRKTGDFPHEIQNFNNQ
ncbi:MAG: AraC family transcriptional regulator [Alistipes senegalensis]|nr:AraC family transcriptional regulator [Alistipes senegalensis]